MNDTARMSMTTLYSIRILQILLVLSLLFGTHHTVELFLSISRRAGHTVAIGFNMHMVE